MKRWLAWLGTHAATWLPILVLAAGAALAVSSAGWLHGREQTDAQAAFHRLVLRDSAEINTRFVKAAYGLQGARGMYATHTAVQRETFRRYVESRNISQAFTGVRAFGFIERVPRTRLETFLAAARADGAPQFTLRQLTMKDEADLYVIKYVEPFATSAAALGLDMGSEIVRRQGILQALETGEATTSGVVSLIQDQRPKPSVLLFLPVFNGTGSGQTPPPAAAELRGLLYAAVVLDELLAGLHEGEASQLHIELFDTASGTLQGAPMYDSSINLPEGQGADSLQAPRFEVMRTIDIPGRLVTMRARSTPAFEAAHPTHWPWLMGSGGVAMSFLLALLLRQQMRNRDSAEARAGSMTAELSRLAVVAKRTTNAVVITDANRRITWVNDAFEAVSGYTAAEALGQSPGVLLQCEQTDPGAILAMRTALNAQQPFKGEILNRTKAGALYWLELDIQPLHDEAGRFTGFMAIEQDITARREMAQAVERQRELLQNVIDNLPCGLVVFGGDLTLQLANKEFARLLDLPPRCVQPGHTQFEDIVRFGAQRGDYGSGEAGDVEARLQTIIGRASGAIVPHQFERAGPGGTTLDGRGGPLPGGGFITTYIDTTARKRAEEEARRSGDLLRGAIDAIDEAFVLYDPQDRLVMCNEPYRHLYAGVAHLMEPGVPFETLIRAGAERGDYAQAIGRVEEWVAERMAAHLASDFNLLQPLADGRVLRIVERKLPDGHIVGFRIDITELTEARQKAELATLAADRALARLQAIYDILPVGILLTDPQGHIIDCNPASERLLGISKAEHLARDYNGREWVIRREDGTPMPSDEFAAVRALTQGIPVRDAVMQVVTPQRSVWLSVDAMPVPHADLGVVVAYVDVTEQRAQRSALIEAKSLAERASVSKSQFLANMSHEIRTPMNAILGMLSLLKRTELSTRQADYASKTEGAARSLLGLLNDILDFSKVEAGKMTLDLQPFRIDQLMRDLGVILSASIGDKPMEVLFDIDPALPRSLVGDAMRLQQVLINLGGNAIKFTEKGEVVVTMRALSQTAETATLQISVRDTGIGIAPENQARIFSGFTQAEASTTRRFGGTGLGLAISQRLVAMMGGTLELDSVIGQGTTFHFSLTLPRADDASGLIDSKPAVSQPAHALLQVLVVDDNATARQLMAAMTTSMGWETELADSAEAALALVDTASREGKGFDVVFMDWQMPGMDGWEAASHIRNGPAGSAPLVVMVSAHGREKLQERSAQDQALVDGFLVKPVTASMLLDVVVDARQARATSHLSAAQPRPDSAQRSVSAQRLAGLRLLVVEDNLNNQQVARELLEDEGAWVKIASNGLEGVQAVAAAEPPFDVVLMDLQMPVMDGYSATANIRHGLGRSTLPIVAMTANAMASDREACLAAGMNDHVGKPFDLDQLVATLLRWGGHAKQQGAADTPARPGTTGTTGTTGTLAVADAVPAGAAGAVGDLPPELLAQASHRGIDLSAALARMGGKRSVYQRLLVSFDKELVALPTQLDGLLQQGQATEARRLVHTIKGVAATLGLKTLAEAASGAEAELLVPRTAAQAAVLTDAIRTAALDALQATRYLNEQLALTMPLAAGRAPTLPGRTANLRRTLDELAALLAAADMRAVDVFEQLQQAHAEQLQGALPPLADAIANLDFERALSLCQPLLSESPP